MAGDFEDMTIEELLDWANGLGVCEFSMGEYAGRPAVKASRRNVEISMCLSRFCDSVEKWGGCRMVSFDWTDKRGGGFSGGGAGYATMAELQPRVEAVAEQLGLFSGQMSLF